MGRRQLWENMHLAAPEDFISIGVRIPRALYEKLNEIVALEGTTTSYLLRRHLITLIRRKCREHGVEEPKLPGLVFAGPKCHRPKRRLKKAKMIPVFSDNNSAEIPSPISFCNPMLK